MRHEEIKAENRVNRGGSWNNDARNCRSANRNNWNPGNRNNNLGFRPASSPRRPEGRRPRIPAQCQGADQTLQAGVVRNLSYGQRCTCPARAGSCAMLRSRTLGRDDLFENCRSLVTGSERGTFCKIDFDRGEKLVFLRAKEGEP
ncbi:MAG: SUMF1/EgtB/PvdO family nonheme iron enzyme [Deltaproteobacteria bacterium]|nr:SUMF1/EgtB/PvdO family nonheme iron enzyme [Deltaproteobacteria bacterium]